MAAGDSKDTFNRFKRSFGPLAGGILLDLVDFITLLPFGWAYTWLLGAVIAWWIGSLYGLSRGKKFLLASLAALYCILPLTEFIPLATILSAAIRVVEEPKPSKPRPPSGRKQVDSRIIEPKEGKEG